MNPTKQPIMPPKTGLTQQPVPQMKSDYIKFLEYMLLIREFEEEVYKLYMKGLIHGTTHLCQGQEAISVGVMHATTPDDYVTVTYRSHGHAIARGMDIQKIFSELMGRADGCCKGKGGSMHLTDFSKNLIGSFGIVGAGIPVAVGAAMSAKLRGEPRVSVTFFGDGAVNIGAFHEALNMAAVWKAPVVFVCENNIYGEFSRFDETTSVNPLSIRAAAYGIPGYRLDGNNILEVYETAKRVIEAARRGEGPSFVEAVTYRQRGHSRTDPAKYRPEEEVAAWLEYDPIHLFEKWLIHHRILEELDIERLKEQVRRRVALAAERAEAAPWPDIDELYTDVYAEC